MEGLLPGRTPRNNHCNSVHTCKITITMITANTDMGLTLRLLYIWNVTKAQMVGA